MSFIIILYPTYECNEDLIDGETVIMASCVGIISPRKLLYSVLILQ